MRRVVRRLFDVIYSVKWWLTYYRYKRYPVKDNYSNLPLCTSGDVVLVIAPHADDELLSCYTILSQSDCEKSVYYCGFTGSNSGLQNREVRRQEITLLCNYLHVPCIDGDGQERNLERLLQQKSFNKIIIPSLADWHPEHRKVNYMLVDICRRLNIHPDIYWYSVTVPIESGQEVRYMPMSCVDQRCKYKLFKQVYCSQSFMPLYRFKMNERINGHYSKCYAAEVFMPVSFNNLVNLVNQLQQDESAMSGLISDIDTTKHHINDIVSVRNLSNRIYNTFDHISSQAIITPHE